MKTGTYRDVDGNLVRVIRTETGYVIQKADGSAVSIGSVAR